MKKRTMLVLSIFLFVGYCFLSNGNQPLTIDSAMFLAQSKLERQFEKADRFEYRNLHLAKNAGDDLICGEVLPLGTPPIGIPWSRFILFVRESYGLFEGEGGGFEFRRRYETAPISADRFSSFWDMNCLK